MEIKTKYNIGDKVWVMYNNNPTVIIIKWININIESDTCIEYSSSERFDQYSFFSDRLENLPLIVKEEKIFPTKEELKKSL